MPAMRPRQPAVGWLTSGCAVDSPSVSREYHWETTVRTGTNKTAPLGQATLVDAKRRQSGSNKFDPNCFASDCAGYQIQCFFARLFGLHDLTRKYKALPIYALGRIELLFKTMQVAMARVIVDTDRD